jgi:hypothetical protein
MAFVSGAASEEASGMRSTWRIGGQEVRAVVEGLVKKIWKEIQGVDLPGWFRVMPYDVAMDVVSDCSYVNQHAHASDSNRVSWTHTTVWLGQARYSIRYVCEYRRKARHGYTFRHLLISTEEIIADAPDLLLPSSFRCRFGPPHPG